MDYDFPHKGGVHTRFRLREVSDPSLELTPTMEIHFINMVKWRKQGDKDIAGNPLHRWLAWLDPQSPPDLVEEVKNMDGAIAFADDRQAFVLRDEAALELYEMRQKAERDYRSEMAFARESGHAEGRLEGLEEGMEQGMEQGMKNVARNALAEGFSAEQVHKITGLDMAIIAGLRTGA